MSPYRSGPVAFIDSGVGGLPYYGAFKAASPGMPSVYVADRAHFPYGPKSREELSAIVIDLTRTIEALIAPSMVVVACNSASVSALDSLRGAFPHLPFVGTVPAVKPAALYSKKRRIGVLATERTVRDPYIALLSERFAPGCSLVGISAPELVDFVEKEYPGASAERRRETAAGYVARFRALEVDAIVLGCTHFLFLAEEFKQAASPEIAVFDSRTGVANRALSILGDRGALPAASEPAAEHDALYVTGKPPYEDTWAVFSSFFDLRFNGCLELK